MTTPVRVGSVLAHLGWGQYVENGKQEKSKTNLQVFRESPSMILPLIDLLARAEKCRKEEANCRFYMLYTLASAVLGLNTGARLWLPTRRRVRRGPKRVQLAGAYYTSPFAQIQGVH
eukprot:GEMP01085706.1.p1 GENE.GEMP01085706.1~~GEMP01085706.1.p1  ORF type:complete len:117 (-),score=10.08 GEMP01085706.1:242-592(-)